MVADMCEKSSMHVIESKFVNVNCAPYVSELLVVSYDPTQWTDLEAKVDHCQPENTHKVRLFSLCA